MFRIRGGWVALAVILGGLPLDASADWSVDVESGVVYNGYNDVRIPGTTGTALSLSEELDADATGFIRVRLARDVGHGHRLSLLVAPLRINASGRVDRDLNFNGVRFAANEQLRSRYRFDSYRLTYHYTLHRSERLRVGAGLTAKIRDAAIRIEGGGRSSENTNTGFVPLINFALDWRIAGRLGLILEGDALAAPQGRAEDILLALYGYPVQKLRLRLGYRVLEGGVDVDDVYNFTLVHYLSAGVTWLL